MLEWSESGFSVPIPPFMAAMHFPDGTILRGANGWRSRSGTDSKIAEAGVKAEAVRACLEGSENDARHGIA